MAQTKIFGIGFHKTGTTSLAVALELLGYRVTGPNGTKDGRIRRNLHGMVRGLAEEFDAFQDNPWPLVYREMDPLYPGSKFILTTRDPELWIKSMVKHFGTDITPMRELIYGVGNGAPAGNERHYQERMRNHNKGVRAYFSNRPSDLLEIDLTVEPAWDALCGFLGKPVPIEPFPHANKAAERDNAPGRPSTRLRYALRRIGWQAGR